MKTAIFALFIFLAASVAAQDQATITVKNAVTSNGVVIVSAIQMATAGEAKSSSFELHCNKGASACKAPEPGTYVMVRLPKNWGMYDCANVDIYANGANPATDQKLGEYCLVEK